MRSPFPGMDPYLESQEWDDFHTRLIVTLGEQLDGRVSPDYIVRAERRVYIEHLSEPPFFVPDLLLAAPASRQSSAGSAVLCVESVECTVPMPVERREAYLVIRERHGTEVVTVIELLSPTNKRRGSTGRAEYLTKREAVLSSKSHLVELDLLRGGERLPLTIEATSDYLALVSRVERRPRAQAFTWSVRQPLPQIPVPLGKGHADVSIDLAAAVEHVYRQARYDLSLDYGRPLDPPWSAEDAGWVQALLANRKQA